MTNKNEKAPQEPTKTNYEKIDGKGYWRMSDGSLEEADFPKVPLTDVLKKPGYTEGSLVAPFQATKRNVDAAISQAERSIEVLNSGSLGEGDRATDKVQSIQNSITITEAERRRDELDRQLRHGDDYNPNLHR